MNDMRPILIAGPTASGKSGLALRLAEQLGGVVINADSMQVYRELRILTARPTPQEEARAPHALYGFVRGAEAYSAGRYAADAARAHRRGAARRAACPIIVGGTGLYFKALLEGLSPIPPIPDDVRAHWRARRPSKAAPRSCTPSSRRAIRRWRARLHADRHAAHRARARGAGRAPACRSPTGSGSRGEPVLRLAETVPLVVAAGARRARRGASTRASTR